jgi:hypothetical protein
LNPDSPPKWGWGLTDSTAVDLEAILRPARIDSYERAFTIGPFGARVSFASQQQRAFNLVWALRQKDIIGSGKRVAVVGGGLAGITAAAGLIAQRCSVHLYETQNRVLGLQKLSGHRYVHPTINFWPEVVEETPFGPILSPTTQFPFFDWYADTGSRIMDVLRQEWRRFFKPRLANHSLNTTVQKLEVAGDSILIHAKSRAGGESVSDPFDAVILAMGFGPEITVSGIASTGYWDLDEWADAEGEGQTPLVTGIGDGGIIDALRAVHTQFEAGRLCEEVVRLLATSGVPALVKKLEARVFDKNMDKNQAATEYASGYLRIFNLDTPMGVKELLDNSLRKSPFEPVELVSRRPHPYSMTAAPIHKFMLTHALQRDAVIYKVGSVVPGPLLKTEAGESPLPDRPRIIRNGPDKKFGDVLTTIQVAEIEKRQVVMGDLLSPAPYGPDDWKGIPNYPLHRPTDPVFAKFRLDKAEEYIKGTLETPLTLELAQDGAIAYFVAPDLTRPQLQERVPPHLFGVRTLMGECQVIDV